MEALLMFRRPLLATTALLLLLGILAVPLRPVRGDGSVPQAGAVSLKKQLEAGLLVRRPEDFAFIARVVMLVDNNQLSRKAVTETFIWARPKRPYPFVFFQAALRQRAAKEGVSLN